MVYKLDRLPDEPIIVFTLPPGGDAMQDLPAALADITRTLDAQTEPVFVIYDVREVSIGVDDVMQAANMGARSSLAVLHHPNVRENVYVVSSALLKIAIKGVSSPAFGQAKVISFGTYEEALAYCRRQIGTGF